MENTPNSLSNQLKVFVMSGDSILYNDTATSVSSRNESGRFDILSLHANFISIIKEFVNIQRVDGTHKEIIIKNAILRVYENNVQIFIGAGE